ncbi:MAG: hypothetical protein IPG04_28220 [Polyangiaceae bacterium]|nr:hypothetical protein [Polyangiaceae bacterium]
MKPWKGVELAVDPTGNILVDVAKFEVAMARRQAPLRAIAARDEAEVSALEQQLRAANAGPLAELTLRVQSLGRRVEALIAQDLFSEKHEQLLAPAFDAIAELVQKTWLPGASGAALAELLTVGAAGSKKPPRAPVRDARLRLDPLPWDELMSATRAALFERSDGGHPQAAAQSFSALRAWRDAHRIAQSPDGNLSLLAAVFDGHSRLWGALEVYPPARVYLLARTLGHWCRMAIGLHEPHWAQAQAFCLRRSSFLRAVLAYGTAMLGRMIVPVHRQESPPKARRPGAHTGRLARVTRQPGPWIRASSGFEGSASSETSTRRSPTRRCWPP